MAMGGHKLRRCDACGFEKMQRWRACELCVKGRMRVVRPPIFREGFDEEEC
jgi:hypothetical protein